MANRRKGSGKSKGKSQRRALDAMQLAEKSEQYRKGQNNRDYSDDEDDYGSNSAVLDARKHLGADYKGNSDDELEDEELDSDEALGSDDDYDILNSKFSQTIRDKKKARKMKYTDDLNEDEDYDSIDESELIPLSEVWALDDADLAETNGNKSSGKNSKKNEIVLNEDVESESEESEEDTSDESDSEDEDESDSEEEEDDEENDEDIKFDNVLSHLKSKLPKKTKKLKSLVNDKSEETEFALPTTGQSLSIMDMMADLEGDEDAVDSAILLKKDTEDVDSSDEEAKALSVPLPQSIQKRKERQAAYEISKNEVEKWTDTVQSNRRAEVLKFTSAKASDIHNAASSFTPVDKPLTELEKRVADVVKDADLESKRTEDLFEDIAVAKLSKEELIKKTNELRLMRELMFRGQRDSKRLKKIKSKTYRQKLRKERMQTRGLVEGSDFDEDNEDGEDEELRRARERMTLKHKNTSQWAKSMIKSGMMKDKENRDEMEEMLRKGEKLRMKQLGHGSDEEDNDHRGLSDIDDNQDPDSDLEVEDSKNRSKLGKGIMNMDFMKNAEERQRLENKRDIEELRAYKENASRSDQQSMFGGEDSTSNVNVSINAGRRIYTPGAAASTEETKKTNEQVLQEIEDDEAKSLSNRLSKSKSKSKDSNVAKSQKSNTSTNETAPQVESNPWLDDNDDDEINDGHRSNKVTLVDESSSKLAKSAAKIEKRSKNNKKHDLDSKDDILDSVEIDVNETLNFIVDPHSSKAKQQQQKKKFKVGSIDGPGDSDYEDEAEGEEDIRMFKNKDLVKEAFAGDDVVKEFKKEKKDVEELEGDKEVDLTLPGWGGWSEDIHGRKKQPKKKIVKTINGVVTKNNRKDKNMKSVIINERVNKKNIKYQTNGVPYPFETMEQYERSLRMPLGQEWTTKATHQKLTMPRVIAKHGSVIAPLKGPK